MENLFEKRLRPLMIDPSLLVHREFWDSSETLKKLFPIVYVPMSLQRINDHELGEFYGVYIRERQMLSSQNVIKKTKENFQLFNWEEHFEKIPEPLHNGFENLRRKFEEHVVPASIRDILLDEFVFWLPSQLFSRASRRVSRFSRSWTLFL